MPDRPPPNRTTTRPEQQAVPRVFKPLPEGASTDQLIHGYNEMASAYATIAAALVVEIPTIKADVSELQVLSEAHDVRIGRIEVWKANLQALPPMRPESPSVNDVVEHAAKQLDAKVDADIRDKSTPPPTVEKVKSISKEVLAAAIAQVKQEENSKKWEELENERKRAETERLAAEKAAKDASDAAEKEAKETKKKLALENEQAKNRTKWALIIMAVTLLATIVREVAERVLAHH